MSKSNDKRKINEKRNYSVVKANELIQNSRFNLSMQEQKIVLFLISKIKPTDTEIKEQEFDIKEFCQICGIDDDNGKNYQDLKESIRGLSTKNNWIKIDEKTERLFFWISDAIIIRDDGIIKLKLHESIKPYIIQLREKFTQCGLIYTLGMRSQYSIRIYELLKSYENLHRKSFTVEELKKMLMCENASYDNFNNFKVKVLDIALQEINQLTDINVEFITAKTGKKITHIEFIIKAKNTNTERLLALARIEQLLDYKE